MATACEGSPADPVETGFARLRSAEWVAARSEFERALAREETADALEGLSWAAWWLDDAAAVFDARQRAYHLYRKVGDASSAARMATWLAIDELDFNGALPVASGWLRRAHRLLGGQEVGPDHGWLAFQEGYVARLKGDASAAERLAVRAAQIGRRFGVPDLEMLGLALQGSSLVSRGEVEEGMRHLDEATALALEGEARIAISGAWACCFLVSACSAARDYDRAFVWCDRIAQFAERYGSRFMLAFCRAEYGDVHLWRGRWAAAEEMLEAAVDDFSRSRPAMAGAPLATLAELRRRQGRLDEAEAVLSAAGPFTKAQLCRARIALERGDGARAADLCERLLRQLPEHLELDRAPVLEVLVQARVATGDLSRAGAAVQALRELAAKAGTVALLAQAHLATGVHAAGCGDHERARAALEDALDGFERCRAPYEAARARIELATSLAALGRTEHAEIETTAARDALVALGADGDVADGRRVAAAGRMAEVTTREREVLGLLSLGMTNRQIAERLVISEHTVHRHVTNILRKLDLPSRAAAAAHAVRTGLEPTEDA